MRRRRAPIKGHSKHSAKESRMDITTGNHIRGVKLQKKFLAVATLACVAIVKAAVCCAGEEKDGFSLGYGILRPVATDTTGKSPGLLTAKYGFSLLKNVTPYIGTGVAYALPQDATATDAPTKLKTGVAGQAGVSFNLSGNSSLVIDYKYLHFTNDPPTSDRSTPPQSLGIGVHIKF
ncbi:porin family protein [Oryzomonas sagensis]|uniref:Porin family protein n=2 Tax=Oryzomonas sagensis TaxID=2603857 RepID=A0ABQ6TTX1_9BACT|nr:porin family protein [Oryzomonas sagensis]